MEIKLLWGKYLKAIIIMFILCLVTMLSSCVVAPNAKVTRIFVDRETTSTPELITVISNLEKEYGQDFEMAFEGKFREISGAKPVEFIPYIKYVNSSYNKISERDSFSNRLFVFITKRNVSKEGFGYDLTLEVKYLNKAPFLVQTIFFDSGRPYSGDLNKRRGNVLASIIVAELKTRNIL